MQSVPSYATASGKHVPAQARPEPRGLRPLAISTLALLGVQYLLGMLTNLFVQIPAARPGVNAANYFGGVAQVVPWAIAHGGIVLALHAALGLLLVLSSLALLVLAIRSRRRAWVVSTIIGVLATLGAGFNGASFLIYGHDFSSMIMATGFLITLAAYATAVYVTRPHALEPLQWL